MSVPEAPSIAPSTGPSLADLLDEIVAQLPAVAADAQAGVVSFGVYEANIEAAMVADEAVNVAAAKA